MAPKIFEGLNFCPNRNCAGNDVQIEETRYEYEENSDLPEDKPKDMVCVDMKCEDCGKKWTVEYRPVAYHVYDNKGNFVHEAHSIE